MLEKLIKECKEMIPYLIIIIIIILVRLFIITSVRVDGVSMNNTLSDGDFLLLSKIDKNYNRFDIVVANYNGERIVKRVIGLPGETVEIKKNKLYINGEYIKEDYLEKTNLSTDYDSFSKVKLSDNCYYIVGDNRKESFDSRYFGCVDKKNISGKVVFRFFPFNSFGKIN